MRYSDKYKITIVNVAKIFLFSNILVFISDFKMYERLYANTIQYNTYIYYTHSFQKISFDSEAWDGSTSQRRLVENKTFLEIF